MKFRKIVRVGVTSIVVSGIALFSFQAQAQNYSGHKAVMGIAETITDPLSGEAGKIEIFRQDIGNGQLSHDFVYGDPRRASFNGGDPGVNFAVHPFNSSTDANLLNQGFWNTESVDMWDREVCSNIAISQVGHSGNPGVVELFFQTGQIFAIWEADLTQVGFKSAAQFPYFAANPNVLGVTFTLFWVDGAGNLTDIDGNGKIDIAFREIYYNDEYEWADNGLTQPSGPRIFDFPTVAIHEVGHGVSAAHFGLIGVQDGFLVAHPRSIMNAIYGGTLRELHGRDQGANCGNWAQWPNR
jgi:hypothetical protein